MEITNQGSGQRYVFPCNKWLSKSEDDFQIERDLFLAGSVVGGNQGRSGRWRLGRQRGFGGGEGSGGQW